MSSILKLVSFLLFVFIISSCAANRIRYAPTRDNQSISRSWKVKRQSVACASPGHKHFDDRNSLMQTIKAFNRPTASTFHKTHKKNNYISKLNGRRKKDTNSDRFISRLNNSVINRGVTDDLTRAKFDKQKISEDELNRWHISESATITLYKRSINRCYD